ncbi:MAG: Leucine dehydrogenase [Chlamydiae bacterium]|nr:Leucine dehydrogenase [Chlamydiota bacterium]
MSLHIKKLNIDDFEEVIEIKDSTCGLHAFVAIHDTTFGPSLGGIRFLPYSSEEEALKDALRLAKGMSYKSALANLKVGGGKSTVICDPSKPKSKELLHAYAEALNYLGGRYIGAEDMNCTLDNLSTLFERTPHVLGLPGEGTGSPAPFTARGTFIGIQATAQHLWGTTSLKGKSILLQGIGGVGILLLEHLFWAGANLYISDLNAEVLKKASHEFGAHIVEPEDVYDFECDIFAPCAQGGILNSENISRLRCKAVAGAANNQLASEKDGLKLVEKNILYAPDCIINCGGVISVASGINPEDTHPQKVLFHTEKIFDRLLEVYQLAERQETCPSLVADQLAQSLILHEKEKLNALV